MTRRMLINAQRPEEVRIAVVTDKKLDRYEVSATESGLFRGNIYRGVVANLQPSLDAAFVDTRPAPARPVYRGGEGRGVILRATIASRSNKSTLGEPPPLELSPAAALSAV